MYENKLYTLCNIINNKQHRATINKQMSSSSSTTFNNNPPTTKTPAQQARIKPLPTQFSHDVHFTLSLMLKTLMELTKKLESSTGAFLMAILVSKLPVSCNSDYRTFAEATQLLIATCLKHSLEQLRVEQLKNNHDGVIFWALSLLEIYGAQDIIADSRGLVNNNRSNRVDVESILQQHKELFISSSSSSQGMAFDKKPTRCDTCTSNGNPCAYCKNTIKLKPMARELHKCTYWMGFGDLLIRHKTQSHRSAFTKEFTKLWTEMMMDFHNTARFYPRIHTLSDTILNEYIYFMTHLILYVSRWGRDQLNPRYYHAERAFGLSVLRGMMNKVCDWDIERACEIVFILFVLGYDRVAASAEDRQVMDNVLLELSTTKSVTNTTIDGQYHEAFCLALVMSVVLYGNSNVWANKSPVTCCVEVLDENEFLKL
jgi:hypothetical protein